MDFVMKLITSAKRGGPDGLFTLQGHLEKYPEFSTDIYDDSPRNVQMVHMPVRFAADDFAMSSGRLDDIAVSVYDVAPNASRAVAHSQTRTRGPVQPSIRYQCDFGTNYQGLRHLMLDSGVTRFQERTLYGCFEQADGSIPPSALLHMDDPL
eukprot:CAMPEP_0172198614 /NCGR_PEP_ID=MMETSP1050-20130122/28192_1 /TAXON_ID=233186 /ORGANISM="Cryptomonas curvata, Strain CCAP979/52" /LENGTH=151 /DNA_ID=CAMNT_0012875469 /DNA_START=108 /DNA_END=563 /DNA_ORIENTATION=+